MDKLLPGLLGKIPDNVFPEPYTVPGNADEETYAVKVKFIKRALVGHSLTMVAIGLFSFWPIWQLSSTQLILALAAVLVALTTSRFLLRHGRLEQIASIVLLLAAIPLLGQLGHDIRYIGYPIESVMIAGVSIGVFTIAVGRDFNFTGMVVTCSLATLAMLFVETTQHFIDPGALAFSWIIAIAYLIYIAYNMAMILKRRRVTDLPSVPADFLRDLLNFTTYPIRIFAHWRSYKFQ